MRTHSRDWRVLVLIIVTALSACSIATPIRYAAESALDPPSVHPSAPLTEPT